MQNIKIFIGLLLVLFLSACNSKPKVIEGEPAGGANAAPSIFQDVPAMQDDLSGQQSTDAAEHKVVAEEALNTSQYTYVRVKENGKEFWVAVMKQEIKTGGTYYFRGGLLKRNFQSQEFNRIFETLYLVSDFRGENAGGSAVDQGLANAQSGTSVEPPRNVNQAPGAIKIADLVANIAKYEGKTVKVTGKCMKINPMIMGRNWLHLQDGSGKNIELTVTTTEQVQVGSVVTLEGTIALNKDFGAGYKYDFIMEGATLK